MLQETKSAKIRRYTIADIPAILEIVEEDLRTTDWKDFKFSKIKLGDMLLGNVNNISVFCNLIIENDSVIGGLCAGIATPVFSHEAYAFDHFLYVKPERRSLKFATELVVGYVEWARQRRVKRVKLSNSMGRNVESYARLASRLGFVQTGTIHSMEI